MRKLFCDKCKEGGEKPPAKSMMVIDDFCVRGAPPDPSTIDLEDDTCGDPVPSDVMFSVNSQSFDALNQAPPGSYAKCIVDGLRIGLGEDVMEVRPAHKADPIVDRLREGVLEGSKPLKKKDMPMPPPPPAPTRTGLGLWMFGGLDKQAVIPSPTPEDRGSYCSISASVQAALLSVYGEPVKPVWQRMWDALKPVGGIGRSVWKAFRNVR